MRRLVLLVLATLSLAVIVTPAASARHTLIHRVSTLESKVKALERKVNALHTFTHNCLASDWMPVGWYGDVTAPFDEFGYVYDNDGPGAQAPFYTTALDIAPSVAESTFVIAIVDSGCVSRIAARSVSATRELSALKRGLNRL